MRYDSDAQSQLVIMINGCSSDHLITPCATRGVSVRPTPQQRDAFKLQLQRQAHLSETDAGVANRANNWC